MRAGPAGENRMRNRAATVRERLSKVRYAMEMDIYVSCKLNEFVAVAVRKLAMPWQDVLEALSALRVLCPSPVPLTVKTHDTALRISRRYGYHIYDSLVIAAALEASCRTLYSEDMRDGH